MLSFAPYGEKEKLSLFKKYSELGLFEKMPVYIADTDSLSLSAMKEIGNKLLGTSVVQKYLPELNNPENQKFLTAYRQKYKSEPDNQASDAYNGMRVVIEALKLTGGNATPYILKSAMMMVRTPTTGKFKFTLNRTGLQPASV
jgi:branched-chain amino acid transport system substrate-binding protein